MAHFAQLDDSNTVINVIVAEQDFIDSLDDAASWVQTSYNTRGGKHYAPNTREEDDGVPLRKNYAGIGFTYDPDRDAFIPPQDYPSWVLNEDSCLWEAPFAAPELTEQETIDGLFYVWDEAVHQTDNTKGWVLFPDVGV